MKRMEHKQGEHILANPWIDPLVKGDNVWGRYKEVRSKANICHKNTINIIGFKEATSTINE